MANIIKQSALLEYIKQKGFIRTRQRGSHAFYKHANGKVLVIAVGRKDAQKYTINQVVRALKITKEDFDKEINR